MNLSKNKLKYIQSLKDKKFRDEYNVFVAEGNKMVLDMLPVMDCELLLATNEFVETNYISNYSIGEVIKVSKVELEKTSFQKNPQQVLAIFKKPVFSLDVSQLKGQLSIALDGIQDPGNLGTIIRLADWYGIQHIICSDDTVDVFNPKVVQATMGALARVRVSYVSLDAWLCKLPDVPVYGTFLDGESMYDMGLSTTGVIVMGNEGNGIRPVIEKYIKNKIFIPNYPLGQTTSESLNVAVATAIICSEFRRRAL